MQIAHAGTGVATILRTQNQPQSPLQAFAQNRLLSQRMAIQMNEQMARLQEEQRMQEETQFLNTKLLPFPDAAQQTVSAKLADFYNQNAPVWQNEFSNLQAEKSKTYSQFHLQLDNGGNPLLDENATPKLYEGGETPDQTAARQNWEAGKQSLLQQDAEGEKNSFLKSFTQNYQQAVQNNVGTLTDPQVQAKLQAMIAQGENRLQDFENNAQLNILKSGLPTPALQEQADQLTKKIRSQEQDFLGGLWRSPEGEELTNYQNGTMQAMLQKKASLLQSSDIPPQSSPGLLSLLVPTSQNPDLADSVQNAIMGVSRQYANPFSLR